MASSERRPSGGPPYWTPGTEITWREGSGPLGTGEPVTDLAAPHFALPMTVVRDDADGLVTRLPIGTPVVRAARADGRGKRDDRDTMFTAPVVREEGVHALFDQVRIAPTGRPWSAWVMFAEGSGRFAGWYVNLEQPHLRDDRSIYTSDHVLDLVVAPDGTATLKDADELALAVEQGVFSAARAAAFHADADAVRQLVAASASPFGDGWECCRPRPLQR